MVILCADLVTIIYGHCGTYRNFLLLTWQIPSLVAWLTLAWIIATPSCTKQRKRNLPNCNMYRTAHVVLQIPRCTHDDDMLAQLHWLPVTYHILYKIALITCKALKFG